MNLDDGKKLKKIVLIVFIINCCLATVAIVVNSINQTKLEEIEKNKKEELNNEPIEEELEDEESESSKKEVYEDESDEKNPDKGIDQEISNKDKQDYESPAKSFKKPLYAIDRDIGVEVFDYNISKNEKRQVYEMDLYFNIENKGVKPIGGFSLYMTIFNREEDDKEFSFVLPVELYLGTSHSGKYEWNIDVDLSNKMVEKMYLEETLDCDLKIQIKNMMFGED